MTQLGSGRRRRGRADVRPDGPAARRARSPPPRRGRRRADQNGRRRSGRASPGPSWSRRPRGSPSTRAAGAGRPRRRHRRRRSSADCSPGSPSRALGVVVAGDTRSGADGDLAALRARPETGSHDRRRRRAGRRPGHHRAGAGPVAGGEGRRPSVRRVRTEPYPSGRMELREASDAHQARIRHRRRRLLARQGPDGLQPGQSPEVARSAGHDAEARPLPQRRSRAR